MHMERMIIDTYMRNTVVGPGTEQAYQLMTLQQNNINFHHQC